MYNLKTNNRLSGFLNPQNQTAIQSQTLRNNVKLLKSTDNKEDGTLVYDNKYIINYTRPNNIINWDELYYLPVGERLGERYKQIDVYTDTVGRPHRIYEDIKTKNQYIDLGPDPDVPTLVRILQAVEPPRSGTPPTTGGNTTQSTEPDCPCDCEKQIVAEQIYINPTRTDSTDTPVKIKVQKRVCTSKDNEKKYIFDCNTSLEEINRQLNSGLNGLADCQCDCIDQLVEQTYYISTKQMQGSIPFTVNTEKIVCNDTNEILNKKVDCEELKASLRARGYTNLADKFDCMLSNGGLRDAISDDNIFTKNDYLIPKITATFVGIFAISKYLMK